MTRFFSFFEGAGSGMGLTASGCGAGGGAGSTTGGGGGATASRGPGQVQPTVQAMAMKHIRKINFLFIDLPRYLKLVTYFYDNYQLVCQENIYMALKKLNLIKYICII
jgi:hypothetical protein